MKKYTKRELKIKKKFGMRPCDGTPLDFPQELGYRCPKGHANLSWSEFQQHIWCFICNKDYHYARECVLVLDKHNPRNLPEQPRIIDGMCNWDITGNGFHDIPKELLKEQL